MAAHSNILACEIPWTYEPGSLQFMVLQRVECVIFTAFAFVSVFTSGISFEHFTGR